MENPSKWYFRRHMGFVAVLLIAIGIWTTIIFFPRIPSLSPLFFALIGGFGAFISFKRKKARIFLSGGFWIASWGSLFAVWLGLLTRSIGDALLFDFVTIVFPIIALATLPLAWFGRWESPVAKTTFKSFLAAYLILMLAIVPFVFAGMVDYNVRADTSVPEVINMKVISRYVSLGDGNRHPLTVETPEGDLSFGIFVTGNFYAEHDIGSSVIVTVRKGALGYEWVDGYE